MGEIKDIRSGLGFSGLIAAEDAIGDSQLAGHRHKPIARWTDIPYQLYREGNTEQTSNSNYLYFGVMAYHSEAIKEVEFRLNGGGGVTVTQQEINPYTNLPEYCVRVNKADIINPENFDPTSDNEAMSNLDLRAIVRPESGVPRILQHDKDAVRGEDATLLIASGYGYSGGKGQAFQNVKSVPGEHGMVATVLKKEDDTSLESFNVFVHPDGNDTTADGTREKPFRQMGKALESLRDKAADIDSRLIGPTTDGTFYVDLSRCSITLLAGEYNADHFDAGDVENPGAFYEVGNGTINNRFVMIKNGWFTITGDPEAEREDIVLTLTEDQAKLVDDENTHQNLTSDFGLLANNPSMTTVNLRHVHFDRKIKKGNHTNFGIRCKPSSHSMVEGNTADMDAVWLHDIRLSQAKKSHSGPDSFLKDPRHPRGTAHILTGTAQTPSLILGGEDLLVNVCWTRSVSTIKMDGDQLKTHSFAADHKIKFNSGGRGRFHWIWFDPTNEETAPYAKYNGYYSSIRYIGNIDEPGTILQVLDEQTRRAPDGITFSWPKNPAGTTHGDPEGTRNLPQTGTIFQKLNHTNLLDLNTPWFEDDLDETDFTTTTYKDYAQAEIDNGDRTWNGNGDQYFGDPANEPDIPAAPDDPSFAKQHGISPEKASKFFWTKKEDTNANSFQDNVSLASEDVGKSIYNPNEGEINEGYKFFEPMYFTPLKYQNDALGLTAYGYTLFDAREPLNANPDDPDWGTTQDFLFRCTGTTWPSAAYTSLRTNPQGQVSGGGNSNPTWPFTKGQFFIGKVPRDRPTKKLPFLWTTGFTSDIVPINSRGDARYEDILAGGGETTDAYPIQGLGILGSRDTKHSDQIQVQGIKGLNSIHNYENVLIAYCDTIYDGQLGHFSGSSQPLDEYKDFAWINNSWCNIGVPSTTGFNFNPAQLSNALFYNNTMINTAFNFGRGFRAGVFQDPRKYVAQGPYLENAYGGAGSTFALGRELHNVVMRNNFTHKIVDSAGGLEEGLKRSTGISWPYPIGSTAPARLERNFIWIGHPLESNYSNQQDLVVMLAENNFPLHERAISYVNPEVPIEDSTGLFSPMIGNYSYKPLEASPLVAGSTLGMDKHVQFDLGRRRRYDTISVGAWEPDSVELVNSDHYIPQKTKFTDITEDIITAVHGVTVIPYNIPNDLHPRLFAKRVKVRASKELDDGTVAFRFSDDILRLERDTDGDTGIDQGGSAAGGENDGSEGSGGGGSGISDDESYLFLSELAQDYTQYRSPLLNQEQEDDDGEDSGQDGDENSSDDLETWLPRDYNAYKMEIFGPDFALPASDANKVKITFTGGNAIAQTFYETYNASGVTINVPFPKANNTVRSRFIAKADASESTAGATLEEGDNGKNVFSSYFHQNVEGGNTMSNIRTQSTLLPQGFTEIVKPAPTGDDPGL